MLKSSFYKSCKQIRAVLVIAVYTFLSGDALCNSIVTLTFNDSVLVNDTVFTVSEIASVTGSDANLVNQIKHTTAGISAPASFGRFLVIREFVTQRLQNSFKEVHFSYHGPSRLFIKTSSRTEYLKSYESMIRSELDSLIKWSPGTWHCAIKNSSDSLFVLNKKVSAELRGCNGNFLPKGDVTLYLYLHQSGREYRMPVKCFFTVHTAVLAANRDIARGETLTKNDYIIHPFDVTHFSPKPFTSPGELAGKQAARTIKHGTILHDRLFREIPAVEKGDEVDIIHSGRGLSIAVAGTARESGCTGDKIWVENGATNKLIRALVTEKGRVTLVAGGRNYEK